MILTPVKAEVSRCQHVACGADFTMWLCEGKVFSSGNPQYGQLGHGTDHEYNAKECTLCPAAFKAYPSLAFLGILKALSESFKDPRTIGVRKGAPTGFGQEFLSR